jgi:hypothetical protein
MAETDIAKLFATDPLKHSEKDIEAIIAKMREARHQFNTAAARPKTPAKQPDKDVTKLSLDLDLGI